MGAKVVDLKVMKLSRGHFSVCITSGMDVCACVYGEGGGGEVCCDLAS